jgi:hypothetical protein
MKLGSALLIALSSLVGCGGGNSSPTVDLASLEPRPPRVNIEIYSSGCDCQPQRYLAQLLLEQPIGSLKTYCVLEQAELDHGSVSLLEGIDLTPGAQVSLLLKAHCDAISHCINCWAIESFALAGRFPETTPLSAADFARADFGDLAQGRSTHRMSPI